MTLNERYQVHERIGEGGMGLVYRATDLRLQRQVAVKMLRPQYAADLDFVARFEQEARAAAGLTHPHIAAVYDTGQDGEQRYIVMELLRNATLKDRIVQQGGRLEPAEAVRVADQIAAAISHAHQRNVVHRDIKPANILFTDDHLVKVTDFGIARALAAGSGTATGTIVGSAHYLSPEQASGAAAGAESDIYSLGVVLYEMLTGRPPFRGETPVALAVQHLGTPPPPPSSLLPSVSPALEQVVLRCLAKRPEERYRSAEDLRLALQDALTAPGAALERSAVLAATERRALVPSGGPAGGEEDPEPYLRPPVPWTEHPALRPVLALVVMLAVGVGIWMAVLPPGGEPPASSEVSPVTIEPGQMLITPNLVGQDWNAARLALEEEYTNKGLIAPQVVLADTKDDPSPADTILSQQPAAGQPLEEGGVIRVAVSSGREKVRVPTLVGLKLADAKETLTDGKLALGNVTQAHSDTYLADIVMRQSAPANSEVAEGSAVSVVVSLGPADAPPTSSTPPDSPASSAPDGPPDVEPLPEVSISVGETNAGGDGPRAMTVVVSVPAGSPARRVALKWLSGDKGTAASAAPKGGDMFSHTVRGEAGDKLGVFVDGQLQQEVDF
ncbi:MAG: Stk1 family PASTA domain-containing Ser/Thr kinase [Fimbriimonadaceae bacterium]|nr:Stk1 family PASTA domain-containing Ser/Thr kinase [Fimbriimonadaceae bacterium]